VTLIYTPDRHLALALVGDGSISAIDSIMHGNDDSELPIGVHTALTVLENAAYIERRVPGINTFRRWPVRLTATGAALLTWFDQRHSRPTSRCASTTGTVRVPRTGTR
jgi:hypothetical protein